MKFFQIVNEKGEKSTGGNYPRFTEKKGKVWYQIGHVRSHLTAILDEKKSQIYNGCRIVQYEAAETDSIACEAEMHEAKMRQIERQQQRDGKRR